MVKNYYSKSDMVILNDDFVNTNHTTITKNILANVTDCISMITAIENYNDEHKLGFGKRVNYAISTGLNYISVLKAYPIGANHTCVIGWDSNGRATSVHQDNRQVDMSSSLSTHIIPNDKIHDVVIGSYDPDKLNDIMNTFKTTDEISEQDLFNIIENLHSRMGELLSQGNYRGLIELFTFTVKNNNLNSYTYEHKLKAYNKYVDCYVRYILALKDIIVEYNEHIKAKNSSDTSSIGRKNICNFIETEDDIDKLIRSEHDNLYGSREYDDQYDSWKYELLEKTFTYEEVEDFKKVIDYDHMKFDSNGMPIWK